MSCPVVPHTAPYRQVLPLKIDLIQFRDTWDVIIVDECHNVSGTTSSLTMYRKVLGNLNARHKYGLSATVHRSDGMIKTTYSLLRIDCERL
ncbi:MAG: DEAD/DEAH box helicase family protein [Clostridiales bacterium]|nr:DEAD/DEAH box helicase family protein [Clostridiales bacterium]MDU0939062.1 DEAD/DEAH box helicase family protein [Clostridiales bacterium]MDU1041803.1 DEAD/DEAH box helicase family protein [Clostridiales bacterium]MDU3489582.1 DEAD/DEAH box helicase family protein [Clostridiales bacterium]